MVVKTCFAAAIKNAVCIDVNAFDPSLFDVVEHDSIANQVSVARHE